MPTMKSFEKTFHFNQDFKAQAERFRWRMKHDERTENAVELSCRVNEFQQFEIVFAFQSRRSMDYAEGYARGVIDMQAYPHSGNAYPIKL